jgi:hypothetical protein
MSRLAVIVTTYQIEERHKQFFYHCITSIRKYHNTATIVILDDNHKTSELPPTPFTCRKEKTKYPRCGEVNAYVWACEHKDEYDTFIYLHDTALLINTLPLDLPHHFRPLWFSSKCMNNNVHGSDVNRFIDDFRVDGKDCKDLLTELRANRGSVVFGAMGIFDKEFLSFIKDKTNFLELASRLNTRFLRSFFERVVYMIYCRFTDPVNFIPSALCGDIFNHGSQFRNTEFHNKSIAKNPYVLKIWQGR